MSLGLWGKKFFLVFAIMFALAACENESSDKVSLNISIEESKNSNSFEEEIAENEEASNAELPEVVEPVLPPIQENFSYIPFTWDGKHRNADLWSEYTHRAIEDFGDGLMASEPEDINNFCPNYLNLNDEGRLMFWIHLISSMVKYESGFKPETFYQEAFKDRNGNYIISRGLLQLSIESARGYKCDLDDAQDLHDAQKNLECGVRIINRWVERDGVVASKRSDGKWIGGARYWSVLRKRSSSKSYDRIRNLTMNNEVCRLN